MSRLSAEDQKILDDLEKEFEKRTKTFAGYPCTTEFDYSDLYRFLKYPINNVGDPYCTEGLYHVHSRELECEVVDWFADLLKAPKQNYWGYCTNGGTEGNMYGLYLARELYPKGVVYYSQDTHYSVSKNIRMLGMEHVMIKCRRNGEMCTDDLHHMISTWRSAPPIIFVNAGTTMKEGFDDLNRIKDVLKECAVPEYYIHVDHALGGMTLPFIDGAPSYDFTQGVQSISISGHKFIGAPMPCGVVLALKSNVGRVARSIEYTASLDSTVTGSRNGFTPLILWHAIKQNGYNGFKQSVRQCVRVAEQGVKLFNDAGIKAWRNDYAITIVFPKPSIEVCHKWQLAVQENIAHVICTQHITKNTIKQLIDDIK